MHAVLLIRHGARDCSACSVSAKERGRWNRGGSISGERRARLEDGGGFTGGGGYHQFFPWLALLGATARASASGGLSLLS